MAVVKLTAEHKDSILYLWLNKKFMGADPEKVYNAENTTFAKLTYEIFCGNYLSNLKNFHAYGYEQDGQIKALISFYESIDEPSWYYTLHRSSGDKKLLTSVFDKVIEHNENNGRLKFYSLTNARQTKAMRKFHWSLYNNERYGYFDEYYVPSKTKCYYTDAWELLYKRVLMPEETIVRCNFLKQEYRHILPKGGNL